MSEFANWDSVGKTSATGGARKLSPSLVKHFVDKYQEFLSRYTRVSSSSSPPRTQKRQQTLQTVKELPQEEQGQPPNRVQGRGRFVRNRTLRVAMNRSLGSGKGSNVRPPLRGKRPVPAMATRTPNKPTTKRSGPNVMRYISEIQRRQRMSGAVHYIVDGCGQTNKLAVTSSPVKLPRVSEPLENICVTGSGSRNRSTTKGHKRTESIEFNSAMLSHIKRATAWKTNHARSSVSGGAVGTTMNLKNETKGRAHARAVHAQ